MKALPQNINALTSDLNLIEVEALNKLYQISQLFSNNNLFYRLNKNQKIELKDLLRNIYKILKIN